MAKPRGLTDDEVAALEAPAKRPSGKGMTDAEVEAESRPAPRSAQLPSGGAGWFEPKSISGTIMRGGAQGSSFGFADELAGAAKGLSAGIARKGVDLLKTRAGRAALQALAGTDLPNSVADMATEGAAQQASEQVYGMPLPLDSDMGALTGGYRHGRDESRLENVQSREANPGTYFASQVAGAVAAPGPKFAKAGTPGRFTAIAKGGAAMGGAQALGTGTSDLTRYENDPQVIMDSVGDTAFGAGLGGVMAPAAAVGGDKATQFLRTASADNALKALGLRAGISNQLTKRGYETADDARGLGKSALDMGLIRPFRTASDVAERAGFAKEVQGSRIENALSDADAAGPFDAERASWQSAGEVLGPDGLSPTAIRESTRARRLVEDVSNLPKVQDSTFKNANKLKSDMYNGINYGTDPALKTTLERRAAGGLRKSIEEQVAEKAGPDVADELRAANRSYGELSDIQPLAQDEATRQLARKSFTTLDAASALGAGALAHSAGGAGAGVGTALAVGAVKALGPRIPSALAVGQQAAVKPLGAWVGAGGANAAQSVFSSVTRGAQPAINRPSFDEEHEAAINAFLTGG